MSGSATAQASLVDQICVGSRKCSLTDVRVPIRAVVDQPDRHGDLIITVEGAVLFEI